MITSFPPSSAYVCSHSHIHCRTVRRRADHAESCEYNTLFSSDSLLSLTFRVTRQPDYVLSKGPMYRSQILKHGPRSSAFPGYNPAEPSRGRGRGNTCRNVYDASGEHWYVLNSRNPVFSANVSCLDGEQHIEPCIRKSNVTSPESISVNNFQYRCGPARCISYLSSSLPPSILHSEFAAAPLQVEASRISPLPLH